MVGPVELVGFALVAVVPLAAIVVMTRKARGSQVETFAAAHAVALTAANRPLIAAYLDRTWRWRLTGAVVGAVVPFGTRIPGLEMVAGYLVGALAAELTESRLRRPDQAAASLTPRSLSDYLPPGMLLALRATALGAVALVPLFLVLPRRVALGAHPRLMVAAALVVVTAALVEVGLRLIVRRPQPAASADLVAADDAIRSASIHATAGAGLAIVVLLASTELWMFGFGTDIQVLRWVTPILSLCGTAVAFAVWSLFGHDRPWRVRRHTAGEVAA